MSDSGRSLWDILGTEPTGDERALKRAYAKRLKVTRPEDDPAGFQELRDAYEYALRHAAAIAEELESDSQGLTPADAGLTQAGVEISASAPLQEAAGDAPDAPPAELWGVIAHEELRMVAPPARPPELWGVIDIDPAEEAAGLWQECLARASGADAGRAYAGRADPEELLAELLQRDALLKFDVREEFELCALRYCASPGYALELRSALFVALGWDHDFSYLARSHGELVREAVQRLRADRSFAHFSEHRDQYPGLDCIMSQQPPSAYTRQLFDKKFTLQLRSLLQNIRWQHGEMLAYKLDVALFERWEHAVFSKRYFSQTALASAGLGFVLHFMLSGVLDVAGWRLDDIGSTASLLGFQALAFVLLALNAFQRPAPVFAWFASIQESVQQRWPDRPALPQLGWLAAFLVLALLLFLPAQSEALRTSLSAGLCITALTATAANHALLRGRLIGCVITAFAVTMLFAIDQHDKGLALINGMTLVYCVQVLALRSMAGIYADLGGSETALPRWRAGWLIGCLAALLAVYLRAAPLPVLGAIMLVLAVTGMLLSPFELAWRAAWPLVAMPALSSVLLSSWQGVPAVPPMLPLVRLAVVLALAVLYFTLRHLYLLHRLAAKPDGLA